MKTDVWALSDSNKNLSFILEETEKTAAYAKLEAKQAVHLRLLAEEMIGMLSELVEGYTGEFWIESRGNDFTLCATLEVSNRRDIQNEKLLAVSSTGKNASATGIINKIRIVVTAMLDEYTGVSQYMADNGYFFFDMGENAEDARYCSSWSLSQYAAHVTEGQDGAWDELEKSIIAKIADDVVVGIIGKKIEIVIKKTF